MNKTKIQHFINENPDSIFPKYKTLDSTECAYHMKQILENFCFEKNISILDFLKTIQITGQVIGNAEQEDFDLKTILNNSNIYPIDDIYINWSRFNEIDKFKFSDINQFLDYLWYPSADDIEIYDDTFQWLVAITHFGSVIKSSKCSGHNGGA